MQGWSLGWGWLQQPKEPEEGQLVMPHSVPGAILASAAGSGASAILHRGACELVTIDNATVAQGQASRESGVTLAMMDSSGPFDFHLTRKLISLWPRDLRTRSMNWPRGTPPTHSTHQSMTRAAPFVERRTRCASDTANG